MAEKEECLFLESCINLVFKQSDYLMSGFPTKIVFGKCSPSGYLTSKHFQFQIFELNILYFAIFDAIKYFVDDSAPEINNRLLLTKFEKNYFFSTKSVICNDIPSKIVLFGIEDIKESKITFQFQMCNVEMNNFVSLLVKILPSSLCLNSLELILFQKASKECVANIKLLKDETNSKDFVKKITTNMQILISEQLLYNLSTLISYYCEIILLYHKFASLVDRNEESDNIVAILRKITHGNTDT